MRWSALAVLVVLLAGCAGSPPTAAGPRDAPADGTSEGPSVDPPAANATAARATDTLFLASATRLAATGLANVTPLRVLAGAQPATLQWNATLNGTGNATHADLALWLDLQSGALQPGVGGDPGCTASLALYVTHNGTTTGYAGGCASAGTGYVPPGEVLLHLGTPLADVPLAPHDGLLVQVAFGLSFPQGMAYVLGGGDRASALTLTGLREPIPAVPA